MLAPLIGPAGFCSEGLLSHDKQTGIKSLRLVVLFSVGVAKLVFAGTLVGALGCSASAQLPVPNPIPTIGLRVHAGYTTSGNFTRSDGTRSKLTGYELGAEFPVTRLPGGLSVNAYPSIMFSNGSTKGNVYRFLASVHESLPGVQAYVFFAAGPSYTVAGSGQFNDVSGFETQVGGGLPLASILGRFSPSLEVAYHNCNRSQIRGFTVGLSAAF